MVLKKTLTSGDETGNKDKILQRLLDEIALLRENERNTAVSWSPAGTLF
jgi:hypothetical protein